MEQTGIYNAHLLDFLHKLHFPIWLESSLQIKKAGGLQRGKTDSIDAQRIAEYAYRFGDQIRLWEPPRQVVQQLALLSATRQRLIQVYNQLAVPLAEHQRFINPSLQKQLLKTCQASLTAIEKDRKAIDKAIQELVDSDHQLKSLFTLITSVPGVLIGAPKRWHLWPGSTIKGLELIDDLDCDADLHLHQAAIKYEKIKPLIRYISELESYIGKTLI